MRYLVNSMFLNLIKGLNRFGRGNILKKSISSSKQILERNYKLNSDFNFIQVGANDGISFDFLYEFVTKRNSAGIVIEPIKEYFKELMINYKNFPKIIKINKAIHPTEKEIVIYRISPKATDKYPDWVKGIASIDFEHHKKTNINSIDIENEIVEAEILMKIILENLNEEIIHYFQVDTEGFDFEILKMLDFTKVKPNMIKYESVNLSKENQDNALSLLRENGYYLFNEFGDTVGVNLNKIKLF